MCIPHTQILLSFLGGTGDRKEGKNNCFFLKLYIFATIYKATKSISAQNLYSKGKTPAKLRYYYVKQKDGFILITHTTQSKTF